MQELPVEIKKPRRGRPPKPKEEKNQTQDVAEAAEGAGEEPPPAAVAAPAAAAAVAAAAAPPNAVAGKIFLFFLFLVLDSLVESKTKKLVRQIRVSFFVR